MDKAKEFLEAIGLGTRVLERPVVNNLRTFISHTSMIMDDPQTAIYIHLKNLVATYGAKQVHEVISLLDKEGRL